MDEAGLVWLSNHLHHSDDAALGASSVTNIGCRLLLPNPCLVAHPVTTSLLSRLPSVALSSLTKTASLVRDNCIEPFDYTSLNPGVTCIVSREDNGHTLTLTPASWLTGVSFNVSLRARWYPGSALSPLLEKSRALSSQENLPRIMLQEIFLSLSGHPSPLLSADHQHDSTISPAEKALLASVAHLSEVHRNLLRSTKEITAKHTSSICQAVAASIQTKHLADFQQKVLEVESNILRKDAGSVAAYNIVPLTAVVGEFMGWKRRMEWFWDLTQFMTVKKGAVSCTGAQLINRLQNELQTGYDDIENAANQLLRVAQTAWLKQVSAWLLYGRLPTYGKEDFCIQAVDEAQQLYSIADQLLPAFVTPSAASSILFIGKSLNQIRVKGVPSAAGAISPELRLLQTHLRYLSELEFPISPGSFAAAVSSIRKSLSQAVLQQMLPLSRILEILHLLREFFLLGRGEFSIALINEADEKVRSRWKRAENLNHAKREGLGSIEMKDGEVAAVLTRTWAAMSSMQGDEEEEDELLEQAREMIELHIDKKPTPLTPLRPSASKSAKQMVQAGPTPFSNLLLSIPVTLALKIPSPLDLFLTPSDVKTYSTINVYLLSIRRAHQRLTNLWKITSLRRHHPAPLAPPVGSTKSGRAVVLTQRRRGKERAHALRSAWATSSAAVFFLGETEAYLQGEVIQRTWEGFQRWLQPSASASDTTGTQRSHDPQSLADAHRIYLKSISHHLLLKVPSFTGPLFHLLQQVDHLVALTHRIHAIWQSLDLETDSGVIDAFSDFHKEEEEVREQLKIITKRVKDGIADLLKALREIDQEDITGLNTFGLEDGQDDEDETQDSTDTVAGVRAGLNPWTQESEDAYVPHKVGRVDRLLMKLDFGGWFDEVRQDSGMSGTFDAGEYGRIHEFSF